MINKIYDEIITRWIDTNKDRIIERWIELAKIPSIKSEALPGAPFGENCAKALNFAAELFVSEGITSQVYTDGGYALAHLGSGEKTIGIFCHSDVVPVGDDWIFTEPFEPIIKDGSLIGRGVEDNKSGIIAALCLMEFLRDNNISLRSHLQAFIGSDEECGMNDIDSFLLEQKMPDISIVPDADFPCSTGEKGIYHFWCESNDKLTDIIDFHGGEAYNIVLDNATAVIKKSDLLLTELNDKIKNNPRFTAEADGETIKLRAKGIAKHASIPDGSLNAAYITAELLSGCENLNEGDRIIMSAAKDVLSCNYGGGIGVVHEDVNFGKMTSVNGMVKVEEGKLGLSFDCRYGDTLSPEYLESESERTLKNKGFTVTYKNNSPGFAIEKDSKVPGVLEGIFAEVTGENLKSILMSGGTYARKLKNAFSIGTFYIDKDRAEPVLEMPDGHGGAHQCDERIDIEGFFKAVRILIHYVLACDDLINE